MKDKIQNIMGTLYNYIKTQTQQSQNRITVFGVVMMINFPLFGVLWKFDTFQFTEEFFLRIIATSLCAMLAFNQFWPKWLSGLFPAFWYFSLMFSLPFFFTYSTLLNHGAITWLMNNISAIFFLLLMVNVADALILFAFGLVSGFIVYFALVGHTFDYIPGSVSLFSVIITYMAAIIIGSLFARDREITFAGRLSKMRRLAGSLAEDLRIPLESIYQQAELQEIILHKLNNPDAQRDLKASLDKINRSVENSKQLINLQLDTMQHERMDTSRFGIISIKKLIHDTLEDYPLSIQERGMVELDSKTDYLVWVDDVGFKNLLWNILKQHYEPYRRCGRTILKIWMTHGEQKDDFNYLHVKSSLKSKTGFQNDSSQSRLNIPQNITADDLAYSALLLITACSHLNVIEKSEKTCYVIIKFPKVD